MFLTLGLSFFAFFFFSFFLLLFVVWVLGSWRFRSLIWSRKAYCFLQFEGILVCFRVVVATQLNFFGHFYDVFFSIFLLITTIFDFPLFHVF